MWSPCCGLLTWRLIFTGLYAFTNMTQTLTPRLQNVVLAFQTWVIFTVLYCWSLKQSIFACCLFTGKVTNHCHFPKNAYRLVINFYFKFDHSLKFEYKYKKIKLDKSNGLYHDWYSQNCTNNLQASLRNWTI